MFLNRKYRILKKMNYFADQRGIFDRYINELAGWASHIENTKKIILNAAENCSKDSCAILGSGWLLDIPLDELSQQFKEVYLFDIIHPAQVKHKLKKYSNVYAIEQDITGGAVQQVYDCIQMYKSFRKKINLTELEINGFSYTQEFDFVASVNILSQLDQMLLSYIKKYDIYNEEELNTFKKILQIKHIETLPKGKTCLITDYEEVIKNKHNQLEAIQPILSVDIVNYPTLQSWEWEFDHGNYYVGKNVIFRVKAIAI